MRTRPLSVQLTEASAAFAASIRAVNVSRNDRDDALEEYERAAERSAAAGSDVVAALEEFEAHADIMVAVINSVRAAVRQG